MAIPVFVDPSVTESVIKIDGVCYQRSGPSIHAVDTEPVDLTEHGNCAECLCTCRVLMIVDFEYYFFSAAFSPPPGCQSVVGEHEEFKNFCEDQHTSFWFGFFEGGSVDNCYCEWDAFAPAINSQTRIHESSKIRLNRFTREMTMEIYALDIHPEDPPTLGPLIWSGSATITLGQTSVVLARTGGVSEIPATVTVCCAPECGPSWVDCPCYDCPTGLTVTVSGSPDACEGQRTSGEYFPVQTDDSCVWEQDPDADPYVPYYPMLRWDPTYNRWIVYTTGYYIHGDPPHELDTAQAFFKPGCDQTCPESVDENGNPIPYLPAIPSSYGVTVTVVNTPSP